MKILKNLLFNILLFLRPFLRFILKPIGVICFIGGVGGLDPLIGEIKTSNC